MTLSRRGLLGIGTAFLAAPAIVRVASLMPVSVLEPPGIMVADFAHFDADGKFYVARRWISWAEVEPMIVYAHENYATDWQAIA